MVSTLRDHASTDEALDEMLTHVISNPRLSASSVAQAATEHRAAEKQVCAEQEICTRVKSVLHELKQPANTSTSEGHKVYTGFDQCPDPTRT